MSHIEIAEEIIVKLQKFIHSKSFKEMYFAEKNSCFSRNRKMPLPEIIAFLTQRSVNSLDIKIDKWIESFNREKDYSISRQAISKARQQIPEKIFHDFLRLSAETFLEKEKKKNWQGYQVYAIDGTDLQIPTTQETLEEFGAVKTRFQNRMAGASASALFDVLNDMILDSVICPYKTCERKMAKELLDTVLTEDRRKKSIVVFDRGYPSYEFLGYLTEKGINYVIRIKEQMSLLRDGNKKDGEVYRKCGGKCRTIRTIQLELGNGMKEYLITNLSRNLVKQEQFQELYFLRWGIEGKYKELKKSIEIECFSGKKSICIKQDFYISLFLANISALLKKEVDVKIEEEKKNEKEYQGRKSYLIYWVNKRMGKWLLNIEEIKSAMEMIIEKCKKKRSQIRRDRKCERNLNLNRRKYSINHKCCL